MAGGCSIIRKRVVKFIFILLITLHAINTQFILSVPNSAVLRIIPYIIKLSPVDNLLWRVRDKLNLPYGAENRITEEPWGHRLKAIFKFIKEDYITDTGNNSDKKPSIFVTTIYRSPGYRPFGVFQMKYYNKKMHSPVSLELYFLVVDTEFFKKGIFEDKYQYIVIEKSMRFLNLNDKEARWTKEILEFVGENRKKFDQRYQAIKEIELPEGLTAVIYKKLNQKRIE